MSSSSRSRFAGSTGTSRVTSRARTLNWAANEPSSSRRQFENDFPRDASTLRLRYVDNRSPEEMAALLDAPSIRAVGQRLTRARDRFRMFCEQSGLDRHDTADLMLRFGEGSKS